MNVSQALKQKNKLAIELKKQYNIAQRFNQIEEGNIRRYSVQEALDRAVELTLELTELKTRIHLANAPVYGKIFQMAELKGRIKELKQIPIQEGKQAGSYGSSETVKQVEINVAEIDKMIALLEFDIEVIQSELDTHNSTTQI
jgi:uncharacterized small protein (DUF1192 family)